MMMKKVISILLVFLTVAAMLHFTVAIHYCGGKIAASKVSLTGKLANCGMEGYEKELPLNGINFSRHCCDDFVTYCGIVSNYIPSFSFLTESYNYNIQVFAVPSGLSDNSCTDLIPCYISVNPPGVLMSTDVDLSDICTFRI